MADHTNLSPNCAALVPLLADYAEGALPPAEAAQVAAHLPGCPACQEQVAQYQQLLNLLDEVPPVLPPLALRDDFLTMLAAEKAALPPAAPVAAPEAKVVPLRPAVSTATWLRIAASVALVAVGTVLGLLLNRPAGPAVASQSAPAAQTLATELAVAASQPATASSRIQLVSEAPSATQPGDQTVPVLISTLNGDPNPNVRLAAAEALFRLRADKRVAPALIQALPQQTDPNVQITLIELLVRLQEKRAVPQLQRLAQRPDALPAVRQQAEQGVGILL